MARIFGIARFSTARTYSPNYLRGIRVGILLNEHIAEDGPTVFVHACRPEGIVSKRETAPIGVARAHSASRSAIQPASPCSRSVMRIGIDDLKDPLFWP
jgi:hypothetical protein